jgi:hypothetical protein
MVWQLSISSRLKFFSAHAPGICCMCALTQNLKANSLPPHQAFSVQFASDYLQKGHWIDKKAIKIVFH